MAGVMRYSAEGNCANTQSLSAYTRFFAPLALQAASQGLTYPLVAMVASRGPRRAAGPGGSGPIQHVDVHAGNLRIRAGYRRHGVWQDPEGISAISGRHPGPRPSGHIVSGVAVPAPDGPSAFRAVDRFAALHRRSGSNDAAGHCPASISVFHQDSLPGGHV